ncbi:MAG: hypothetical protein EAZ95_04880 [Bacteroidetes bacterium]|nr:MAG: hypothetical protein EAZ95_04880 [Bacteroidota bacterium]
MILSFILQSLYIFVYDTYFNLCTFYQYFHDIGSIGKNECVCAMYTQHKPKRELWRRKWGSDQQPKYKRWANVLVCIRDYRHKKRYQLEWRDIKNLWRFDHHKHQPKQRDDCD